MKHHFRNTLVILLLCCQHFAQAEPVKLFSIGSGDISGNYYPVARAICEAFNASDDTRRRCSPEPSAGSIYNLTAMQNNEIEFAIVQSDWQAAAFTGSGPFENTPPMTDLRVLSALYPETITILAGRDTEISLAADLLGKTVDIGRASSGRNATVKYMLQKMGFTGEFFGSTQALRPEAAVEELCEGTIDATILVVGHPSSLVAEAMQRCGARMIPFHGPAINALLEQESDYRLSTVDLDLYGVSGDPVLTLSVMAMLVTRTTIEDTLILDLVTSVETAAARLAKELPVLTGLPENLQSGVSMGVPLHPVVGGDETPPVQN